MAQKNLALKNSQHMEQTWHQGTMLRYAHCVCLENDIYIYNPITIICGGEKIRKSHQTSCSGPLPACDFKVLILSNDFMFYVLTE